MFTILADKADLEIYVWQCIKLHPTFEFELNTHQKRLSKHEKAMMPMEERALEGSKRTNSWNIYTD